MAANVIQVLKRVGDRQRRNAMLENLATAMSISAAAATVVGIYGLVVPHEWLWMLALAVLAIGPLLAIVYGVTRRSDLQTAARAVDRHADLKDRTLTALEFSQKSSPSTFEQWQIRDATAHLQGVELSRAVPLRLPAQLGLAVLLSMAAGCLLLVSPGPPATPLAVPTAANPTLASQPSPTALSTAADIRIVDPDSHEQAVASMDTTAVPSKIEDHETD